MEGTKKLFIVGAGDGGIILSHSLPSNFDITFIDPQEMHYFQPWLLHIAFEGAKEKSIPKKKLIPKNSKLIKATVQSVDLQNRRIITADGNAYSYDYVVVDTGSTSDYSKIPGHAELYKEFGDFHSNTEAAKRLYSKLLEFKGGNAVIGATFPTFKCPPSPNEAAFLFEQFVKKKGIKKNTEITFITPFPRAYPAEPMNEIVEPIMKERGINIMPFFDVEEIDTATREIKSIEGDTLHYDFAALVPPHKGAGIVAGNSDEDGFVNTDKLTLQINGYDDAFCIGDATNIPTSKSAVTAHLEAKVVSKRLQGIDVKFDGRTNCPMETGYRKGTFVIGSYDAPVVKLKPSTANYLMKKGMAMMAWPALKGKMDWLFNYYFSRTDPKKLNEKLGKKMQNGKEAAQSQ